MELVFARGHGDGLSGFDLAHDLELKGWGKLAAFRAHKGSSMLEYHLNAVSRFWGSLQHVVGQASRQPGDF
jgi:hypothetical protein